MQKTKIRLAIAAIAILAASAAILTSCDKSELNMDLDKHTKALSLPDSDCPIGVDIEGPYNPGKTVFCDNGQIQCCDYSQTGNCWRPIIKVDTIRLNMLVSNGPSFVVEFFSGEEWKDYWPDIDIETLDKLRTGEYYFYKIDRSETSCFYAATKSTVIDATTEYLVVLPVEFSI